MSQVIVSPRDMRTFAKELAEYTSHIKARDRELAAAVKSLGSTWADHKYRKFAAAHAATTEQLQAFYRHSDRYVRFLSAKAAAADRYLDR